VQKRDSAASGVNFGGRKVGRRSSAGPGNMRSSVGNGLVLETLEDDLQFGDVGHHKAQMQLEFVRTCVRLRCVCIPYISAEIKKTFNLPEDQGPSLSPMGVGGSSGFGTVASAAAALFKDRNKANGGDASGGNNLNRTKSSIMSKLFTAAKDSETDSSTVVAAKAAAERAAERAAATAAAAAAYGNNDKGLGRGGGGGGGPRIELSLMDILLTCTNNTAEAIGISVFARNLREVIQIEEKAVETYLGLKAKDLRTTVFAGFALQLYHETHGGWTAATGAASLAKFPTHLSRVLLTLGNERRLLAEELGDLSFMHGDGSLVAGGGGAGGGAGGGGDVSSPNNGGGGAVAGSNLAATSADDIYKDGAGVPITRTKSTSSAAGMDSDYDSDNEVGAAAAVDARKKTYCEGLLYKDYLYRQLCVNLLTVYQDLIQRLRTDTFASSSGTGSMESYKNPHGGVTAIGAAARAAPGQGAHLSGPSAGPNLGDLRQPLSLGQALEEYKFIKVHAACLDLTF
jgi:hypothetical protein